MDSSAHAKLEGLALSRRKLQDVAEDIAVGRMARVISNFNGQPYGSSKKPLTGQLLKISGVCLTEDGRVTLITMDPRVRAGFELADVELLERE